MQKIKISLFIALLLFNGCDSSSRSNNENIPKKNTFIQGKTTLSKATVCIDENINSFCDKNELQTISDEKGEYKLSYKGELPENSIILAQEGYNLILLEDNNAHLAIKTTFSKNNQETNINTITTFIAQLLEQGLSFEIAQEQIAKKYHLDVNFITNDPLNLLEENSDKNIFLTIHAIENNIIHAKNKNKISKSQKVKESGNLVITEEEADEALLNFDIFSFDLEKFQAEISKFFVYSAFSIADSIDCILSLGCEIQYDFDTNENNISLPIADENDSLSQEFVSEYELSGIWYEAEGNSCFDINYFTNIWTLGANGLFKLKDFILEDRKVILRKLKIDGGHIFPALSLKWDALLIYKSQNIEDKFYLSSIYGQQYTLTSMDTLENCNLKKDKIDKKLEEERRLNVGGELSIHSISADLSDTSISRDKLNGVWYQIYHSPDVTYEIFSCVEIKENNTIETAEYGFIDYFSTKSTFTYNNTTLIDENTLLSTKVYKSKTSPNTLYFKENTNDFYKKLIPEETMDQCKKKYERVDLRALDKEAKINFEKQWKASNIQNYTFELTKSCFCPQEEVKEVSVQNGYLENAIFIPSKTPINLSKRGDIYSLDGFFTLIQNAFDKNASVVTVQYDYDYGYPTKISINQDTTVTDGGITYKITNFKILDATTPTICTQEYVPLCAEVIDIQCITTPCQKTEQTFSNFCELKADKRATFLHEGVCK